MLIEDEFYRAAITRLFAARAAFGRTSSAWL
jgi:hypothetical protein